MFANRIADCPGRRKEIKKDTCIHIFMQLADSEELHDKSQQYRESWNLRRFLEIVEINEKLTTLLILSDSDRELPSAKSDNLRRYASLESSEVSKLPGVSPIQRNIRSIPGVVMSKLRDTTQGGVE